MSAQIHGHEVIQMIVESGKPYTKDTLRAAILQRFGEHARFCTCSAQDLTADGLIDFLEERGKFLQEDGGMRIDESKVCE